MNRILIIGGGAAGMIAAVFAAKNGNKVELFEKNEKLGKKLFITGKGRCNITNAADLEDFFPAVTSNPKFLYSAFYSFTNEQVISFFEELGVKTKVERGGRVFPVSDHSSDVIHALKSEMERLGVKINLRHCRDRRHFLSVYRLYRRRIPLCTQMRSQSNRAFPVPCANGSERMVCR